MHVNEGEGGINLCVYIPSGCTNVYGVCGDVKVYMCVQASLFNERDFIK